jgi:hypothetical protein
MLLMVCRWHLQHATVSSSATYKEIVQMASFHLHDLSELVDLPEPNGQRATATAGIEHFGGHFLQAVAAEEEARAAARHQPLGHSA